MTRMFESFLRPLYHLIARYSYEFGGPWGVFAIMTGFPVLMYYLWTCLWFYDGRLVYPHSLAEAKPLFLEIWGHIKTVCFEFSTPPSRFLTPHIQDASPNWYAWKVYTGFMVHQLLLAHFMPWGYQQEGLPVPSLGYKTLMYNCNALVCVYTTLLTAAGLHYFDIFRLTGIIDNFGHLMTVAMFWGWSVSFFMYFATIVAGEPIRMSGNFIYDVFMGACLNPRIGKVDLKMWAEVRIPWHIVFFLSVSGCLKQYEAYGYVTPVRIPVIGFERFSLTLAVEHGVHDSCDLALPECLVRAFVFPSHYDLVDLVPAARARNASPKLGIYTMKSGASWLSSGTSPGFPS